MALSDSTAANGAMRVIPESHKLDQVPPQDTFRAENLLSRGQEVMVEVDERPAAMLTLSAGEMSLHHVCLIHGSDPNPSGQRLIGFAIRYIPTLMRPTAGGRDHATMVRGVDAYGHFKPEERPDADMSWAIAHHAAVTGAHAAILMRETEKSMRA